MKILIIALSFYFFFFSTAVQSADVYRCEDAAGSILLTDRVSPDPSYKCTVVYSYKEPTPADPARQYTEPEIQQQISQEKERNTNIQNEISKLETEINNKESELQSLNNRLEEVAGNLYALSNLSVEIEAKKGEIEVLRKELIIKKDPTYQPDPNEDLRRKVYGVEFELER
jgi:septal ring factor EnvC (AmiA/AmiB activator)